jgi:biotin transport system substrate-specific component
MILYLGEGAAGAPVFTPHGLGGVAQLLGPTAGFLFAFPLAAAAAGAIVRSLRSMRSQFAAGLLASSVATSLFLAMGAIWLEHLLHLNAMATWRLAIAPFLPGEAYKAGTAACFYATLHRWRRA